MKTSQKHRVGEEFVILEMKLYLDTLKKGL